MQQYTLLTASTSSELAKKINEYLKKGWYLHFDTKVVAFGVNYVQFEYSQAMTKNAE